MMCDKSNNMYEGYIYKVTNLINSKSYIGQTTRTIDARWKQHIRDSNRSVDELAFHRAIRLYGVDNFKIEKIETVIECDSTSLKNELNILEIFYINRFNSYGKYGYNMTIGGDGFCPRSVILYDYNGKCIDKYTSVGKAADVNNLSSSAISHCCTGNTKGTKVGVFRYEGDLFSKYDTNNNNNGKLAVIRYDSDGNIVNSYDSMTDASIDYKVSINTIKRWIENKKVIDLLYLLSYKDDNFSTNEIEIENDIRINKYDKNGKYIETYVSASDAGRQNNTDASSVIKCCNNKVNTVKGFIYKRYIDSCIINDINMVKPVKYVKSNNKKTLTEDEKIQNMLINLGYCGRIDRYDAFGELIYTYDNVIDASADINVNPSVVIKACNGNILALSKSVFRYQGDKFGKYPRSKSLQPISAYSLNGDLLYNFETIIDAENFVGCCSGDITKTIKRGGSCKNYLFSYYGDVLIRNTYQNIRTVEMCDKNFNVIKIFYSKKEASEYFNYKDLHHGINIAINNKTEYMGYYWKYSDEVELST